MNIPRPSSDTNVTKATGSGQRRPRKRQSIETQVSGQRGRTFRQFEGAVLRTAGDDSPSTFIRAWATETRMGKSTVLPVLKEHNGKRLKSLLSNIKQLHAKSKPNDRNVVLSVIAHLFSRKDLNTQHGFSISADSWTKARKIAKNGMGQFFNKTQVNANMLSEETVNIIRDFWMQEDVSREAANRTVIVGSGPDKLAVPVRYLLQSDTETYVHFIEAHPDTSISSSSFYKYKPEQIKKAQRQTDMCPICTKGKEVQASLQRSRQNFSNVPEGEQAAAEEDIKALEEQDRLIGLHRQLKTTIRATYNAQKMNLKVGQAMIIMDFKENMKLGRGRVQTSRDFYNTPHRSVFTIAVYTRRGLSEDIEEDRQIRYFTFVSDCLAHDTQFVFDCFRLMLAHDDFKALNIQPNKAINLWVDNAPQHFRTFQMLNEFAELSKETFKHNHLRLNYFAEYHGKCVCDSHFSLLSRYYRDYSKCAADGVPVYTTPDFLSILRKAVDKTNATKERLNAKRRGTTTTPHRLLQVTFFNYERAAEAEDVVQLVASQFTSYYHFRLSRGRGKLLAKLHQRAVEYPRVYNIVSKNQGPARAPKLGWSQSKNDSAPFNVNELARKEKAKIAHEEKTKKRKHKRKSNIRQPRTRAPSAPSASPSSTTIPPSYCHDFVLSADPVVTDNDNDDAWIREMYHELEELDDLIDGLVPPPQPQAPATPQREYTFISYSPPR